MIAIAIVGIIFFFPKECNIACCEWGFCRCFGIPIEVGEKKNYHVKCIGIKYHPCCDECGGWVPLEDISCSNYSEIYCDKETGSWTCDTKE